MANKFEEFDDAELYSLLKNQDSNSEKAFSVLYDRHSQRLFAYCKRFLNNREAAQDIFQEAFVKFYNSSKKDRVMTNVPAFLLRIARNLCLNYKRTEVFHTTFEDYMTDTSTFSSEENTSDLISLVKIAIEQLPEEYKEPFILREYEGLGYADIADITGESLSNIKVRIHRAKLRIKDIVAELENAEQKVGQK